MLCEVMSSQCQAIIKQSLDPIPEIWWEGFSVITGYISYHRPFLWEVLRGMSQVQGQVLDCKYCLAFCIPSLCPGPGFFLWPCPVISSAPHWSTITLSALRRAQFFLDDYLSFPVLRLPLLRGMPGTGKREVPLPGAVLTPEVNKDHTIPRALGDTCVSLSDTSSPTRSHLFPHLISLL